MCPPPPWGYDMPFIAYLDYKGVFYDYFDHKYVSIHACLKKLQCNKVREAEKMATATSVPC